MSNNPQQDITIDPFVAQTIEGRPRYKGRARLQDPEDTKEQQKAMRLERRASRQIRGVLDFIYDVEDLEFTIDISNITKKYGYLFAIFLRHFIEEVYKIGSDSALTFDKIRIPNFTTLKDIEIIQKWTIDSLGKLYARMQASLEKQNLTYEFVINSVLAEISTFVLMESTKEKTKQLIDLFQHVKDFNFVSDSGIEFAQAAAAAPLRTYQGLPKDASTLLFLLNLKGISEVNEYENFGALEDPEIIEQLQELKDRYFFVWVSARDDKVCKKYCAPLDGIMWSYDDIGLIPLPDMLTHPRCRCMIFKVGI